MMFFNFSINNDRVCENIDCHLIHRHLDHGITNLVKISLMFCSILCTQQLVFRTNKNRRTTFCHPPTNFSQFILLWKWVFGLHSDHWNKFKVFIPTYIIAYNIAISQNCSTEFLLHRIHILFHYTISFKNMI